MEEIPGVPRQIPPLASYPNSNVKTNLTPAEWDEYLDSWLFSIEFRLRLQDEDFSKVQLSQHASGIEFLYSLFQFGRDRGRTQSKSQKERLLLKRAYMLLRRLLLGTQVPFGYDATKLLDLLGMASQLYASVGDWKVTLQALWKRNQAQMTSAVESWKKDVSRTVSTQLDSLSLLEKCRRLNALIKVSAETGLVLMTGSDHLETLMEAYDRLQTVPKTGPLPRVLTEHIFYCLRSLMSDGSAQTSMLLDHLYHMKAEADRTTRSKPNQPTLYSGLVCQTSFLRHLAADNSVSSGKRGRDLLEALTAYRQNTLPLLPAMAPRKRRVAKGKGKADGIEEMHIHKASHVSQVHELFPDLPNNYILELLDHFHDNTEAVVAALLEPESLPADLQDPTAFEGPSTDIDGPSHGLAPHSTPALLPPRRNVFDGDDLDNLRISSDRLHRGRKEITVDQAGTEDEHARRKAAIMSALAAFDSDDDERDDTYDVTDVGGTVDSTLDSDRPERDIDRNPHEQSLFRAWKDNQEMFARDRKTRASKIRQDLKRDTGMSDEQLEGWAIMLKKDSKLQDQLEKKYSASKHFAGTQTALASTKWQGGTPEDSEGESSGGGGRRTGQTQMRGNRTWAGGHGGGGRTSGPSGDVATQVARRRKEQGRGRGGANHGRREGRARKMGRGMAGGTG
ncbi:uncharacterized protein Z518_09985 [Rhinocladiella mackenziei CBS 650.93]|uniref:Rhinocladiella mackenziei CBS 650.93 unplaced genomic scaffold supercont1.8, whole genome shotgun sequence n=1 Tax=Rhinocladiella mackenziei CBS 650.93 TaxID=1442369 RepID=A0A0D2IW58_9EURO|nr:uncharacterized protein Z518_09985 [Rhinocladiella mackenziei CBS 650.93]KIX00920.1 hypothetical protein Z518_09985 [Rhinocladiella mackenziei CBS 650.93]